MTTRYKNAPPPLLLIIAGLPEPGGGGGARGAAPPPPPHNLAGQLTLFKSRGQTLVRSYLDWSGGSYTETWYLIWQVFCNLRFAYMKRISVNAYFLTANPLLVITILVNLKLQKTCQIPCVSIRYIWQILCRKGELYYAHHITTCPEFSPFPTTHYQMDRWRIGIKPSEPPIHHLISPMVFWIQLCDMSWNLVRPQRYDEIPKQFWRK